MEVSGKQIGASIFAKATTDKLAGRPATVLLLGLGAVKNGIVHIHPRSTGRIKQFDEQLTAVEL
jgi:hypothetical protein